MLSGLSPFYAIGASALCTEYKTQRAHGHTRLSSTHGPRDGTSFEAIA